MPYVDGFVLAVPRQNIEAYQAMARHAGAIWMEHGALSFVECIADDTPYGELTSFPRAVQAKDDRSSCSPGSPTDPASSATRSTPR